jgi:hypothetical protein
MIKDQEYDYFYEEGDRNYCYPNSNVLISEPLRPTAKALEVGASKEGR